MDIKQSFTVERPIADVWALFQNVAAVAACMPGAELLEDKGNGSYRGRVGIKLGPFTASFEGDAQLTTNTAERTGHLEGRGTDKRGGSRSKLVLDYRLAEASGGTKVDVDADIQLSGPIAQFGRTGLVTETANVLIRQFVKNVEAKLMATSTESATPAPAAAASPTGVAPPAAVTNQVNALRLIRMVIASFFRRLFGRSG